MKQFMVRVVAIGEGVVRESVIRARSAEDAAALAKVPGQTVLSVRPAQARTAGFDYPLFCRELMTLLKAGMTVVEAVETLAAKSTLTKTSTSPANALLQLLQQGQSLSVALSQMPNAPSVLIALIRGAERTGEVALALGEYLHFQEILTALRRKVINAAIYPTVVCAIGLLVTLFLILFVLPTFSEMYSGLRVGGEAEPGLLIEFTQTVAKYRWDIAIGIAFIGVALGLWIRSGRAWEWLRERIEQNPWVADRFKDYQLALFYRSLSLMLKGGYPLPEGMRVSAENGVSAHMSLQVLKALDQITGGQSVSQSLAACDLCDEVDRRLMLAAEKNGQFGAAAAVVAQIHGERFEYFIDRVARLAEPVLLGLVAMMVGGLVVAMYLPIFELGTQIR